MEVKTVLEGLLFLCGDEGLTMEQMQGTLETSREEVESALVQLKEEYDKETHGIELTRFGGIYKFVSKATVYPYAEKLFASTKMASLSQAAMETLAIIAYKQPITRAEIEEIRGVGCDMMIRKLMARSLIKESGRSDAPGKPFLYEITPEFMDAFKLESLKELPELPKEEEQGEEELFDEV
ncbi:SMC-Scp complex subunit ScpB [Massilicoli timonensis]|uniref:SMC-Scp complex subunit ScpB n=1 Tax=Massilicoli timonensis TaxID=2015901 RepID=UPI003AB060C3